MKVTYRHTDDIVFALFLIGTLLWAIMLSGCAAQAPPSLSPTGVRIYQANQALLVLDMIQRSAIGLNRIQICEPAPCRPMLSDDDTRQVIDTVAIGVKAIQVAPAVWKVQATSTLNEVSSHVGLEGRKTLSQYVNAGLQLLLGIS